MSFSRREFLLAALLAPAIGRAAPARFSAYPFTLGVASGYPTAEGIALWTRLAPKPLEGGGMDPGDVEVQWELAEDDAFRRIVKRGTATAPADFAHSVHVEVEGLAPARHYHYRFHCGDATSATGHTRTAPQAGRNDERLRLVVASCQQYEQGWFTAHRHAAAEEADLLAFVGDYIYESSWGREHVRKHGAAEPATVGDYRDRYALYKLDPDLRQSHAACPWVVIWDDHEVDNDYAGERSEELDPSFVRRRSAAYRAFYEHMPMRRSVLVSGGTRIHTRLAWGSLAQLHLLDNRQYRSPQACTKPYRGGGNVLAGCDARLDPALSMLGREQEAWLDAGLADSRAAWNLIVQTTLFAPAPRPSDKGPMHWTDGWDGYPAARERLLGSIVARRPSNPVLLGGDVHACVHADLHAQPARPDSPIVATEFVATSITSQGPGVRATSASREANPHLRHYDGMARGYTVLDITRGGLQAHSRVVATVKQPDAGVTTAVTARVESGSPGIAA